MRSAQKESSIFPGLVGQIIKPARESFRWLHPRGRRPAIPVVLVVAPMVATMRAAGDLYAAKKRRVYRGVLLMDDTRVRPPAPIGEADGKAAGKDWPREANRSRISSRLDAEGPQSHRSGEDRRRVTRTARDHQRGSPTQSGGGRVSSFTRSVQMESRAIGRAVSTASLLSRRYYGAGTGVGPRQRLYGMKLGNRLVVAERFEITGRGVAAGPWKKSAPGQGQVIGSLRQICRADRGVKNKHRSGGHGRRATLWMLPHRKEAIGSRALKVRELLQTGNAARRRSRVLPQNRIRSPRRTFREK